MIRATWMYIHSLQLLQHEVLFQKPVCKVVELGVKIHHPMISPDNRIAAGRKFWHKMFTYCTLEVHFRLILTLMLWLQEASKSVVCAERQSLHVWCTLLLSTSSSFWRSGTLQLKENKHEHKLLFERYQDTNQRNDPTNGNLVLKNKSASECFK